MNDYIIPEGMKLYKEHCFVNFFRLIYDPPELPSYDCSPQFVPIDFTNTIIQSTSTFNPTVETYVGFLFIIASSILGITIIELLYNKADWFLTPLVNCVVKRYNYTIERNRLLTMRGHP
jgi:hypothetical protein